MKENIWKTLTMAKWWLMLLLTIKLTRLKSQTHLESIKSKHQDKTTGDNSDENNSNLNRHKVKTKFKHRLQTGKLIKLNEVQMITNSKAREVLLLADCCVYSHHKDEMIAFLHIWKQDHLSQFLHFTQFLNLCHTSETPTKPTWLTENYFSHVWFLFSQLDWRFVHYSRTSHWLLTLKSPFGRNCLTKTTDVHAARHCSVRLR